MSEDFDFEIFVQRLQVSVDYKESVSLRDSC